MTSDEATRRGAATQTNPQAAGDPRPPVEDEAGPGTGLRDLAGLAIAAALFGLAALIVSDAVSYPVRRTYAQFGPAIFPYLVAAGVAVMAGLTALMAWRGGFPAREELHWPGFLWALAAIVAQIALLAFGAGFVVASAALFGLAARGFGQKPVWRNVLVGGVVSGLLYVLFRYGLGLSLPAGPLENALAAALR